ncbi:hypothetical protein ACWGJ2_11545 [Streptomyces sp. NPDC054796]
MFRTACPARRARRSFLAGFLRQTVYAATLLSSGLAALAALTAGRKESARARWLRAGTLFPGADSPGAPRVLGHAVLTVLLGASALVVVLVECLAVARGLFYGLVDDGPYNTSWGGPSLAGAWLTHAAVAAPIGVAGLGVLWLLARLHQLLTARLRGTAAAAWAVPTLTAAPGEETAPPRGEPARRTAVQKPARDPTVPTSRAGRPAQHPR